MAEFHDAHLNPTYKSIVENRSTLTPNQKSAGPVVSILFALRMLDVASIVHLFDAAEQSRVPRPAYIRQGTPSIPRTVFEGDTSKLRGIASLCDNEGWPQMLINLQRTLDSSSNVDDPTLLSEDLQGTEHQQLLVTAFRQLKTIAKRDVKLTVAKALLNMESTAFFINYMLQGKFDFPSRWKDLESELKSAAYKEGIPFNSIDNLPPLTRLRQPLLLALAVSPLILLSDITPTSSNLSRVHMLRAWYHYGNERPTMLIQIEGMLWQQLFSMARGRISSMQALKSFMVDAKPLLSIASPDGNFFDPTIGVKATMPLGLAYTVQVSPLATFGTSSTCISKVASFDNNDRNL
ncbi:hypothetical protein MPER_12987 [Moniliophthora perniciosa FA553]|nr:hypothetical protein MPER_12987 [Moniliophthora perniciosa FA553]